MGLLSVVLPAAFWIVRPARKSRLVILCAQIACFAYWNIVIWGYTTRGQFEGLFKPSGATTDGSIFMTDRLMNPLFAAAIILELWIVVKKSPRS